MSFHTQSGPELNCRGGSANRALTAAESSAAASPATDNVTARHNNCSIRVTKIMGIIGQFLKVVNT